MKAKVALIVGAMFAAFFGLVFLASPESILKGFGMGAHGDGIIFGRDLGAIWLGIAVLNWVGRNAAGRGLRALLGGNLFIQFAELLLDGTEILTHQLPGAAWPGLSVHAALVVLFGIALIATRERNRRRSDQIVAERKLSA